MDINYLTFSIIFSFVGIGFYGFGRKTNLYFQVFGIILMIFPYFVSSLSMLITIGIICTIAPFVLNWIFPF